METFLLIPVYFVCGFLTYVLYQVSLDDDLYNFKFFSKFRIVRVIVRLSVILFWPITFIFFILYLVGSLLFEIIMSIFV